MDFQSLPSLELFPYKTPFKLFATHTHLQTVNKYKQKIKVFFIHELTLYRQLPPSQSHKEHHQRVLGTFRKQSQPKIIILLFQESALPGNSPNACRQTHWLSHCHTMNPREVTILQKPLPQKRSQGASHAYSQEEFHFLIQWHTLQTHNPTL